MRTRHVPCGQKVRGDGPTAAASNEAHVWLRFDRAYLVGELCRMAGLGSGPGDAIARAERRRTELADVF
jgi:hypothetical protein